MEYRSLGSTGVLVSRIALGTVELGMDYGFRGSQQYNRPGDQEAIRIIHGALDLGINLIDTARNYGSSEELIGKALRGTRGRTLIASKVNIATDSMTTESGNRLRDGILGSIETSLKSLKVETLDILQIHDTTLEILHSEEALRSLEDAHRLGKIRFIGASCRDEKIALASLDAHRFDAIQVPFNILDRRMMAQVFPRTAQEGVGVMARSTFLRGVLTNNVDAVPKRLAALKEAALSALEQFQDEVQSLSELALRFSLSCNEVSSVILGVRSLSELESNVADFDKGPLSPDQVHKLSPIYVVDPSLTNPQNWSDLI